MVVRLTNKQIKLLMVKRFNFVLLALLLLMVIPMRAVDVQYLTIVSQGNSVSFALSEKPVITYQYNQLVVATAKETIEIPVADITGTRFEESPSSIHNLMSEDKPQIKGCLICFSDLIHGTLVQVFTSDGHNIVKVKADYSGTAQVNLSEFPKGIYLIKAGKQTIKIINK